MSTENNEPNWGNDSASKDEGVREIEGWAKERKLNASSATTRQLYKNRDSTVQAYVSEFRKGRVNEVLPEEAKEMLVEDAIKLGRIGNVNIRKLLVDSRDKFQKR